MRDGRRDERIAAAIADAVLPFRVPILGMALRAAENGVHETIELIPEFYADLEYDGNGDEILSRVPHSGPHQGLRGGCA